MLFFLSTLLAVSSVFYLRGVSSAAYLQPVVYSLFIIFLLVLTKAEIFISKLMLKAFIVICITFLLLSVQFFLVGHTYGLINEVGRIVFPFVCLLLFFALDDWILIYYGRLKYIKFLKYLIYIATAFLLLDQIFRFYDTGKFFPTNSRYELKNSSLFFIDSNFGGLIAAILLVLNGKFFMYGRALKLTLVFLIVYSFSLAVYISLFLAYIYSKFYRGGVVKLFIFIFSLLLTFYFFGIFDYIFEDGSMQTKIEIISLVIEGFFATQSFIEILFGVGFGNFKSAFDYVHASHNLFGLVAEGGLIFLLTMFLIFYWLWTVSPKNHPALIVILVAGAVSLFPIAYFALPFYLLFLKDSVCLSDFEVSKS